MSLYNEYFVSVKENEINLSEIEDELELEKYIRAIYEIMMSYIGLNSEPIQFYIMDFINDEMIDVKGKTNEQIFEEIRDDILNEFRKDFNYLCFEDKNRS